MEQIKCPGQDTRFWKFDDIFTLECPKCGAEIEFFKDDTRRRCAWCGHLFYNPKIELGCAEWCQYADKCVPELVAERRAMATFKERLAAMVKERLAHDSAGWEQTDKGLKLALELLKAEGGDPKVVFAAVLLHRLTEKEARELLAALDTEPEIMAAVIDLISGTCDTRDPNCQIFRDILQLLSPQAPASSQFATRTARRLAAAQTAPNNQA